MIILVGKTCSGKSTVANLLEEKYGIPRIRTYTTRPRRENENDEYHFLTTAEFIQLRGAEFFFETTSYNVASGDVWYYGTAKSELTDDCCIVMNPEGIKKIKELLPKKYNIKIVYLNVTEGIQWNRLRERGQNADETMRRVSSDKIDFSNIDEYYNISITTDNLTPEDIADMIYNFATNY